MATGISARLTAAEGRRFGLTVGGVFLAIGALLHWRGRATASIICLVAGGALALAGLAIPRALGPVYRAWMGLAHLLSKVTSPLLMGAVYYLVITPMGLVMRALGRNPLVHHTRQGSYWVAHKPSGHPAETMRHQF